LGSIPAQMGKVRQIKRNRVFNTYLSAFPSITCKTRNKCALIIPLNLGSNKNKMLERRERERWEVVAGEIRMVVHASVTVLIKQGHH